MWSTHLLQGYVMGICLMILCLQCTSAYALTPVKRETCRDSKYCHFEDDIEIWTNECGLERPTRAAWERNEDRFTKDFEGHFNRFVDERNEGLLQGDENTFPQWFTKRMAPNHPSSEMVCDGLSQCSAPSCEALAADLEKDEKESAQFIFEFLSTLDHAHHAMDLAVSDFFEALSSDLECFTKEFTYADELQQEAIEKKREQEMIFAIITALLLTLAALTGTAALFAGPMTAGVVSGIAGATAGVMTAGLSKVGSTAQRVSKGVRTALKETKLSYRGKDEKKYLEAWEKHIKHLDSVTGSIVASGFIGITGFVKESNNINHGSDIEGFDKLLALFKHYVAEVSEKTHKQNQENMITLVKGWGIAGEQDLLDFFKSGFYSGADVDLRAFISSTMTKTFTARFIGSLWRDEGVHIVESMTEGNMTCEQDTRGPGINRVCLPERPRHTYNLQAFTHWNDEKIYRPPGLQHLIAEGGYKGVTTEDVVRSSLFQYEIWRPRHPAEEPSLETILLEAAKAPKKQKRDILHNGLNALDDHLHSSWTDPTSNELVARANATGYTLPILEHYGDVPAAINLPICRSWFGQALSGLANNGDSNAPCFCDAPNPSFASRWEQPNNWTMGYTQQFILEGQFYRINKYGKMCHETHDCNGEMKWKQVLGLPADEEVPEEMEDAWERCLDTGEPGGGAHHSGTTSPLITTTVTREDKVIVTRGTEVTTIYTIPSNSPTLTRDWVTSTSYIEQLYTTTRDGKEVVGMWRVPVVSQHLGWVPVIYPPQPTITSS